MGPGPPLAYGGDPGACATVVCHRVSPRPPMPIPLDRSRLKHLLALASTAWDCADPAQRGLAPDARDQLRARRRGAVSDFVRLLLQRDGSGLPAPLADICSQHRLRPRERALLMMALHYRIAEGAGFFSGRDLAESLAFDSYELLGLGAALAPGGRLVRQGLLVTRHTEGGPLDADFRICEPIFRVACRIAGWTAEDVRAPVHPYRSAEEHLAELEDWVELHRLRAGVLFPESPFATSPPSALLAEDLTDSIGVLRERIDRRIRCSSEDIVLPLAELAREFHLDGDEELVLAALFSRRVHGPSSEPPWLDAGDVVRLVAATRDDVLRKWSLLRPDSKLRQAELVLMEGSFEEQDSVGDVMVAGWVAERILETVRQEPTIRPDERRRFHRFLDGLSDSEEFYRRL